MTMVVKVWEHPLGERLISGAYRSGERISDDGLAKDDGEQSQPGIGSHPGCITLTTYLCYGVT